MYRQPYSTWFKNQSGSHRLGEYSIMIGLAVLYIAGEAPFLGIAQVVVYTGAVMTLVLFVVMLVGVGGDEPVSTGSAATTWIVGVFGLGLVVALVGAVVGSASPAAEGLDSGARATPAQLAVALFGDHVVVMELTGLLLIIAAVGALALTHRERIRPRITQRTTARAKMRAYAERGAHPGQKPMSGVFAATNTAAAPALDADGEAVEESVPRVLRVRGQGLELAEVSPESSAARAAGRNRADVVDVARSGMASMPGVAARVNLRKNEMIKKLRKDIGMKKIELLSPAGDLKKLCMRTAPAKTGSNPACGSAGTACQQRCGP